MWQHMPHWFHAADGVATLVIGVGVVCMLFLPRRWRIVCFFIVTPWEVGVIATANYTFLDYLVLSLGILLLDDRFLRQYIPRRLRKRVESELDATYIDRDAEAAEVKEPSDAEVAASTLAAHRARARAFLKESRSPWPERLATVRAVSGGVLLALVFYSTAAQLLMMPWPWLPLPRAPMVALEPFRIANQYGLFAVMTRGRYEIEFQGSNDGTNWAAYPYRYKPQALNAAAGHLCAVSAAAGLEFVVRIAGRLDAISDRAGD